MSMYDTVKLRSPILDERTKLKVEAALVTRSAVRRGTGEVVYELTSDSLKGTYDNRISILLKEEVQTAELHLVGAASRALADVSYSIIVECSIHKAMAGHNITGGPQHLASALYWFVDMLGDLLGVVLPAAGAWKLLRVDVAECFQLTPMAMNEYLRDLRLKKFKRRFPSIYPTSITWPGSMTTFKVYMKGPEFRCHDAKILKDALGPSELSRLQKMANSIMRVETSIKARMIKESFGGYPDIDQLWHADNLFREIHRAETEKVMREGEEVEQVRTALEVKARLFDLYSKRNAITLYGVWCDLATIGQEETRKGLMTRSYYRYIKLLTEAGISWTGTDVVVRQSNIPLGFTIADPARWADRDMLPAVAAAQREYAIAL